MSERELDPERGREVAEGLRELGVRGILITAAKKGYISELKCEMKPCRCPDELGGAEHFDRVPEDLRDWMPTAEHIEWKSMGGKLTVDNVKLAHRLCNRIDYNERSGFPTKKDEARIERARERTGSGKQRLTIEVSSESLSWAVRHINDYIAAQPDRTDPRAHEFVSALTNPAS